MDEDQRNARIFGVLFIITFLTSIPAFFLYQPALDDPAEFIAGTGGEIQVYFGVVLELLLIISNIGTAVVLYPIARRQNEILSLGYVTARLVECMFIGVGILFVLGIVSLRQNDPGASTLAVSFAAIKDWTMLLGPGFTVGIGNGLILGYLMYRSRLVPRGMAMLGLIGGPLLVLAGIGILFGAWDADGPAQLAVIPEFLWELSLGIYAAVKGFKRDSPILSGARTSTPQPE
ncbi:MAG TPA: DUF4386 domain-containing protein [Jiangellaceae bacterium]|jgi:hypothetical protein